MVTAEKENLDLNTEYPLSRWFLGTPVPTKLVPKHTVMQGEIKMAEPTKGFVNYFEQAVQQILDMHRKKASDYTDAGEFDNFIESAQASGIETYQAIENLIGTKEARIRVIRRKMKEGKDASNEPLLDSYLDRAVYSIISYAHELMRSEEAKPIRNNVLPNEVRGRQGFVPAHTTIAGYNIDRLGNQTNAPRCKHCQHVSYEHDFLTASSGEKLLSINPCKCCSAGNFEA